MRNMNDESPDTIDRLARIETIVSRLEQRLLGNGQPGELDKINGRLMSLEKLEAKGRGAFWILTAIMSLLSGALAHIMNVPGFR